MRKYIMQCVCFVMTLIISTACSDDDKTNATTLQLLCGGIEVNELSFNSSSSYKVVEVSTNADWKVSVPEQDKDWLSVTPHSGFGWNCNDDDATNNAAYFKVIVKMNATSNRNSSVTVSSGDKTMSLSVTQSGRNLDPEDPFESVWDMTSNFVMGYNLGNSLDSNPMGDWWDPYPHTPIDWETSWGQPETTPYIINAIHAKGFNVIRVGVTWMGHLDSDNNIDKAWMDRVEEVVNMVLDADCYCIINLMHDCGDASYDWLDADLERYPQQTVKFQKVWHQIAERFRDYNDRLIFEAFNEICNINGTTPKNENDPAFQAVNLLLQDFVNTVRATGGNNEYRNLACPTYATNSRSLAVLNSFKLPDDIHSGHLYATVHCYEPYDFCGDNHGINADGTAYDYNKYTFDSEVENVIDECVERCAQRFHNELGVPFVFSEFAIAPVKGKSDGIDRRDIMERTKYATSIMTKLHEKGTIGMHWMGLYDRWNDVWTEMPIVNAMRKVMGLPIINE